jgi:hypothetical protein
MLAHSCDNVVALVKPATLRALLIAVTVLALVVGFGTRFTYVKSYATIYRVNRYSGNACVLPCTAPPAPTPKPTCPPKNSPLYDIDKGYGCA